MTQQDLEVVVAPLSAIPLGEGRTFDVGGEQIAVFNTRQGRLFAVQAGCPHKGGPLADGLIGESTVICPLHAWKYDLATGDPIMGSCKLKTYPVRLDDRQHIVLTVQLENLPAYATK